MKSLAHIFLGNAERALVAKEMECQILMQSTNDIHSLKIVMTTVLDDPHPAILKVATDV